MMMTPYKYFLILALPAVCVGDVLDFRPADRTAVYVTQIEGNKIDPFKVENTDIVAKPVEAKQDEGLSAEEIARFQTAMRSMVNAVNSSPTNRSIALGSRVFDEGDEIVMPGKGGEDQQLLSARVYLQKIAFDRLIMKVGDEIIEVELPITLQSQPLHVRN